MSQDLIHLNVGGVHYTTTIATLCRYPDSMLGAMFNGAMATTRDESGRYFIDRDGSLFIHVLNFLRSTQLALPNDFKHFDELQLEADFYQIQPLIDALRDYQDKQAKSSIVSGHLLEVIEVRAGSTATMPTNNSRVKTIIVGRKDVINSLPEHLLGTHEKLVHKSNLEFAELELNGSSVRLKLAEYLHNMGWRLTHSDMSSSAGYDSRNPMTDRSMMSSLIIEHSYRDRWLLPDQHWEHAMLSPSDDSVNSINSEMHLPSDPR